MRLRTFVYAAAALLAQVASAARAQAPADGHVVGSVVYQDGLPAKLLGPRKIAVTAAGDLFVADVEGRLHRLTPRGELVGTSLDGVTSVASGAGLVFAALRSGVVLELDPRTGRVVGRIELGASELPSGLAFDEGRGKLWIAFASGMLQARAVDGSPIHEVFPTGTSPLVRLVDVAVDPAGLVWAAQDRNEASGFVHAVDAETGEYVRSISSSGASRVRVVGGIAVTGGGLYVSDLFSGEVKVFDRGGAVVDTIGGAGGTAGKLRHPAGVAFTATGDLLVANMDLNRVERFGSGAALPVCSGDTDCDGLPDAWEQAFGTDPLDPASALSDLDGDGLNDSEEYAHGSNPRMVDTDGDGFADGEEVLAGFNPTDRFDHLPQLLPDPASEADPGVVVLASTVRDPAGRGDCTVHWRQLAGAAVTLDGATTASPRFVARSGAYRFEGVAICGGVASLPAVAEVSIRNVAPVADGGRVVAVPVGVPFVLSGAASSDANGDLLLFSWDQLLGAPVIGSTAAPAVTGAAPQPGYYLFMLGAWDPEGQVGVAEVPVVAVGDGGAPTAIASSPVLARAGERAVLDASGSYRSAAATFSWEQVAGPYVELDDPAAQAPGFVVPEPGRYVFQVSVNDDGVLSPPATVELYAAAADAELPVAAIRAPAVAAVNAPFVLDGGESTAPSGGAPSYGWRQVAGPAAGLTRVDRAAADVVAFEPGSYVFELVVVDGAAVSKPARVRVEARSGGAAIPRAVATAPGTARVGDAVVLDGTASEGAAGFRWTQVEGPWVAVEGGAVATFQPVAPGVYGFELEVDDGKVRSAPSRVDVVVFQNGTGN